MTFSAISPEDALADFLSAAGDITAEDVRTIGLDPVLSQALARRINNKHLTERIRYTTEFRQGTIVSVDYGAGKATITLAGNATQIAGVPVFASANVAAGNTVWVMQMGPDYVVMGILAADSAWTSLTANTSTWTSTTSPTNYSSTTLYQVRGKTLTFEVDYVCESGWTAGSGTYSWKLNLPTITSAAATEGTVTGYAQVGGGSVRDACTGRVPTSSVGVEIVRVAGNRTALGFAPTTPASWTAGDHINFTGSIAIA